VFNLKKFEFLHKENAHLPQLDRLEGERYTMP